MRFCPTLAASYSEGAHKGMEQSYTLLYYESKTKLLSCYRICLCSLLSLLLNYNWVKFIFSLECFLMPQTALCSLIRCCHLTLAPSARGCCQTAAWGEWGASDWFHSVPDWCRTSRRFSRALLIGFAVSSPFFFFSSSCPTLFSNLTWMLTHTELFFFCETAKAVKCASHILMYIGDIKLLVCSTVGLSQGHLVMFFLLTVRRSRKSL